MVLGDQKKPKYSCRRIGIATNQVGTANHSTSTVDPEHEFVFVGLAFREDGVGALRLGGPGRCTSDAMRIGRRFLDDALELAHLCRFAFEEADGHDVVAHRGRVFFADSMGGILHACR